MGRLIQQKVLKNPEAAFERIRRGVTNGLPGRYLKPTLDSEDIQEVFLTFEEDGLEKTHDRAD